MMTINLDKNAIDTILSINNRYYFGLFKEISIDEEEEYKFRDALIDLAAQVNKKIKNSKND